MPPSKPFSQLLPIPSWRATLSDSPISYNNPNTLFFAAFPPPNIAFPCLTAMTSRVRRLSRNPFRTVSIFAAAISTVLNVFCAVRVIAFGGSLKWDFDSEGDALNVDAVKFLWFLLVIYFAAAATASVIGFIGIARVRVAPSLVRILSHRYSLYLVLFACALCPFNNNRES